jgi:hypothetical protein
MRRRQLDPETTSCRERPLTTGRTASSHYNTRGYEQEEPTSKAKQLLVGDYRLFFKYELLKNNPITLLLMVSTLMLTLVGIHSSSFAKSITTGKSTQFHHRQLTIAQEDLPLRTFQERVDFVQQEVHGKVSYIPVGQEDDDPNYNVFDCPLLPLPDYPREYPVMDVLGHWPIDDTSRDKEERTIHQGVCVFDFATAIDVVQLKRQILTYRQAEVPFVIRNDPSVLHTVERWNTNDYLFSMFGNKLFKGEYSKSNHMMYWAISRNHTKVPNNWVAPTEVRPYTYPDWHKLATSDHRAPSDPHHYIRMDACLSKNAPCDSSYRNLIFSGLNRFTKASNADFLFGEMPFFDPASEDSELYLVKKSRQRGIQCRMGMEGIVSENHCDGDRNFIAVLGGERRYVIAHPRNCLDMALYPMAHPMERHSAVNWSAPNLTKYPNFPRVQVNEVVLEAGDVLYLPTQWFHHIVSLNLNYQCNTRSGYSSHYAHHIRQCGFHYQPQP